MKKPLMLPVIAMILTLCLSDALAQSEGGKANRPQSAGPETPTQPLAPEINNSSQVGIEGFGAPARRDTIQSSTEVHSDTHLLSGAEALGLGSLTGLRNIFDPAFQFSELAENGLVLGHTLAVTSVGANFEMQQHRGRYHLTISYHGAETIYQPSYLGIHYLPYQDGVISQEVILGRWTLRLRDDGFYSWGPSFGSLFTGGPAETHRTLSSIEPSLASNATIQTGLARQVQNTAMGEIDYAHSRHGTLTLVGSYALTHFIEPGYINSNDIHGRFGYNYAIGAKNNVALTYDLDRTKYVGTSSYIQTDVVQVAFGRKVAGRLAFQLAAGPQLVHLGNLSSSKKAQVSWSASASLTYQWTRRTGYALSYFRGVSAGSGVFFGSRSETITASANHDFTQFWSASVNGGYATNKALATNTIFASRFDNWFAGASLNRQLGREVRFTLSYGFQQQTSRGGPCPVLSCSLPGAFSQFGLAVQWHPRGINSGG